MLIHPSLGHRGPAAAARAGRRGSALLLSFLVLIVIVAIMIQLGLTTAADSRVAQNEVTITVMDEAIESALLEAMEQLKSDAEAAADAGGGEGAPGGIPGEGIPGEAPGAPGGEGGEETPPTDSREDAWAKPQRTTINEIELRILIQDEDSKLNVLTMLTEDEDEAELALERVARVLDLFREDTRADLDRGEAQRLAEAMLDHMRRRRSSDIPKPLLQSDLEEEEDIGLPLSLREFAVLKPFEDESLFRDFRDQNGDVVHSIESFLTVYTCLDFGPPAPEPEGAAGDPAGDDPGGEDDPGGDPAPGGDEPGGDEGGGESSGGESGSEAASGSSTAAGIAVNVNTAPLAVLQALTDSRDVGGRFWSEVLEYRNEREEDEEGEEVEPTYDEYGNEIFPRKIFDDLDELEEVPGASRLDPESRARLEQLLKTESEVFSIMITARRATGQDKDLWGSRQGTPDSRDREDEQSNLLTRTVRCIVWRTTVDEEIVLLPLARWEVLGHLPFEVLDFPDDNR